MSDETHKPYITTTPFVYIIGWSLVEKYYVGSRYAWGCNPSDILNWCYKTSSKTVNKHVKEMGEPNIKLVLKSFRGDFNDIEIRMQAAREYENEYLKNISLDMRGKYININFSSVAPPIYKGGSDNTLRMFYNEITEQCIISTQSDFYKTKGLIQSCVNNIVNDCNKSHKNWYCMGIYENECSININHFKNTIDVIKK